MTIKNRVSDEVIASGDAPLRFEGNYYFDEEDVDMEQLEVTQRIYTCWYKGRCFWVDLKKKDGSVQQNVAWIYREPSPGYEQIKDKIGFSSFSQGDLVVESSEFVPGD